MHIQYLKYILNYCIYGTFAQLKYKKVFLMLQHSLNVLKNNPSLLNLSMVYVKINAHCLKGPIPL